MKSLSEVSKITGLSRRQIQELENDKSNIAPKPEGHNKYGYLLYNDEEVKNLWQLSFYKALGCDRNGIRKLVVASPEDKAKQMDELVDALETKIAKHRKMIQVARLEKMIGISCSSMRFGIDGFDELDFEDTASVYVEIAEEVSDYVEEDMIWEDVLSEDEELQFFDCLENILALSDKNLSYDGEEVQQLVSSIHDIVSKEISQSMLMFSWYILMFAPDGELAYEINQEYGDGKAEYLYKALKYYCGEHTDNEIDVEYEKCLGKIVDLGLQRYAFDSSKVQDAVDEVFAYFRQIPAISECGRLFLFRSMGMLFGSDGYNEAIQGGRYKKVFLYISKAIKVYCKRELAKLLD